jgi:hypothetical protein
MRLMNGAFASPQITILSGILGTPGAVVQLKQNEIAVVRLFVVFTRPQISEKGVAQVYCHPPPLTQQFSRAGHYVIKNSP